MTALIWTIRIDYTFDYSEHIEAMKKANVDLTDKWAIYDWLTENVV